MNYFYKLFSWRAYENKLKNFLEIYCELFTKSFQASPWSHGAFLCSLVMPHYIRRKENNAVVLLIDLKSFFCGPEINRRYLTAKE